VRVCVDSLHGLLLMSCLRYKVRSEIARQQKDKESEFLQSANRGSGFPSGSPASSSLSSASSIEKVMSESAAGYSSRSASASAQTSALEEEVAKWRSAYERAVRENEQMRSSRGAMMLSAGAGAGGAVDMRVLDAAEWRDRFEACVAEKLALMDRVDVLSSGGGRGGAGQSRRGEWGGEQLGAGGKPVEKAYLELREEYKEFRRKVLELEQDRERRREKRRKEAAEDMGMGGAGEGGRGRAQAGETGGGMEASKMQYVRHLILQYLSCKDAMLKDHMEQAIVALFRYNSTERESILERKKEENPEEAVYSSVRSLVNTFGLNY
jgi:hypothetical protein